MGKFQFYNESNNLAYSTLQKEEEKKDFQLMAAVIVIFTSGLGSLRSYFCCCPFLNVISC